MGIINFFRCNKCSKISECLPYSSSKISCNVLVSLDVGLKGTCTMAYSSLDCLVSVYSIYMHGIN